MAGSADDHLSQALQLSCTYEAVSLHESEVSLCLVQDLSENELGRVLKSGLRPREWATVRLVSKRWKALADSCADCVNVGLTDAAWFIRLKWAIDIAADEPCAKAASSRLCYEL